jgi:hypothetical protein
LCRALRTAVKPSSLVVGNDIDELALEAAAIAAQARPAHPVARSVGIPSQLSEFRAIILRLPRFAPRSGLSTTNWYSGS